LAIPVLLILAVLWAAVLVPPVLRSRRESRGGGVGDLHSRLGALNHRRSSARVMGARGGRAPLRSVPTLQASRSRAIPGRAARGRRPVPGAARSTGEMTPAQKRRRDVLLILIGAAIISLGLSVLVNPMLWITQGVADVLLVAYLFLLVLQQRGSVASRRNGDFWSGPASSPRPVALAHPRVPARPELAPLPRAAKPRRTAAG
jgi:hypothetical protein